jgi:hypothetical protein
LNQNYHTLTNILVSLQLFDLMSMGFKKQVIACASPQQLLHVTLTHLESVKNIVQDAAMIENIQGCVDRCISLYGNLSMGQWLLLRQSLLRFLQGKKIKVSLFLQQGLQTVEGSLVVDLGGNLPYGTELPGKHRIFEGNSMVRCVPFYSSVSTLGCTENDDAFDMDSTQGGNVYMKEKEGAVAESKTSTQAASVVAASRVILSRIHSAGFAGATHRRAEAEQAPQSKGVSQTASSAKAELSMLADLLGMAGPSSKDVEEKPFKFNLFPGDDYSSEGKSSSNFIMFDIDGSAGSKTVQQYMDDLNLKDEPKSSKPSDDDDDDLLALMDSSAK